jgi:hypothetical protein
MIVNSVGPSALLLQVVMGVQLAEVLQWGEEANFLSA